MSLSEIVVANWTEKEKNFLFENVVTVVSIDSKDQDNLTVDREKKMVSLIASQVGNMAS